MKFNYVELNVSAPMSWKNKAAHLTLQLKELGLLREDASENPDIDPAEYEQQQFVDWVEALLEELIEKNRTHGIEVSGVWAKTSPDKSGWYLCKTDENAQPSPLRYVHPNKWLDTEGKIHSNVTYLTIL